MCNGSASTSTTVPRLTSAPDVVTVHLAGKGFSTICGAICDGVRHFRSSNPVDTTCRDCHLALIGQAA